MFRHKFVALTALAVALATAGALSTACSSETPASAATPAVTAAEAVTLTTASVDLRPIERHLRVTGSLLADEQAEVSSELAGRVTATPVERGTRVPAGALLVRISGAEPAAQLQEAVANAGQIEARLGLTPGETFDHRRVPDVMNAQAALDWAEAEFTRIQSLLDQKVVSKSEWEQRRTQVEAARQQYKVAVNLAEQSYRSLQGARARVVLASKSMADTLVRAPFAGLVAERAVSVGDYVTKGARVATVVSIDPLRVELTVPEQAIAQVKVGQRVRLSVDAYPGEEFAATIRFVSPSVRVDQRALTVEAIAPNPDGRLKPGLFATAIILQAEPTPALTVPVTAVETVSGTSRVYVVKDGKTEERIVTIGQKVDVRVEITSGVKDGELVVAEPRGRITDGMKVRKQ
jgi:RND family efflux transporter MFP subunit